MLQYPPGIEHCYSHGVGKVSNASRNSADERIPKPLLRDLPARVDSIAASPRESTVLQQTPWIPCHQRDWVCSGETVALRVAFLVWRLCIEASVFALEHAVD